MWTLGMLLFDHDASSVMTTTNYGPSRVTGRDRNADSHGISILRCDDHQTLQIGYTSQHGENLGDTHEACSTGEVAVARKMQSCDSDSASLRVCATSQVMLGVDLRRTRRCSAPPFHGRLPRFALVGESQSTESSAPRVESTPSTSRHGYL